jgi:hypothetical protein
MSTVSFGTLQFAYDNGLGNLRDYKKDEIISESQELRETDSEDEKDIDSKIHSTFN